MESHFNQEQNIVIGYLRSIRLLIASNSSILTEKYDAIYGEGYVPLNLIHFVHNYYYRKVNFFLLCSGSSEAQNNKYNQLKLINAPSVYEQQNDIKYDEIQYVLKLHPWKSTINPLRAKLNQSGPKSKKKKKSKKKTEEPSPISTGTGGGRSRAAAVNLGLPTSPTNGRRSNSMQISPNTSFKKKKNAKKTKSKKKKSTKQNHTKTKSNLNVSNLEIDEIQTRGRSKARQQKMEFRKSKSVAVLPKAQVTMTKINANVDFDRYGYGKCVYSTFELPKWGWLKQKKMESGNGRRYGHYHMFLRCGGIKAEFDDHCNEIDLMLFNSANCNYNGLHLNREVVIDAYYTKLPSFRKELEAPFILFHEKKSTLYSFGGYSDGKALSVINECSLNANNIKSLKWRKNRNKQQMIKGRYNMNVCGIGNEKYLILGGKNKSTKDEKTCEMYDNCDECEQEKCTDLATMKYKRSGLSSVYLANKKKVIAGGGMIYGKGSLNVEIYDVVKDKWTLNKAEFNFEHKYPMIWMDAYQPSVCYIAGDWIGIGGRKDSLGYIEWIDLRQKQKKWNLFKDETLTNMFKIEGVRANIWESRSLIFL